uniref:Uncharacterized protein n=1 Tax=Myotis myotis TaxID=51298 RepID=A0A7J7UCK9_MYOMY|nr:hypothetical protein mMyoMyo1_008731 [Myotis myotis]
MEVNHQQRWQLICIRRRNDGRRKGKDRRMVTGNPGGRQEPVGRAKAALDWRTWATLARPPAGDRDRKAGPQASRHPWNPGAALPEAPDPDLDPKARPQARQHPGTQEPVGEVCRQSSYQAMRGRVGDRRSYRSSSGRRLKTSTGARNKD